MPLVDLAIWKLTGFKVTFISTYTTVVFSPRAHVDTWDSDDDDRLAQIGSSQQPTVCLTLNALCTQAKSTVLHLKKKE